MTVRVDLIQVVKQDGPHPLDVVRAGEHLLMVRDQGGPAMHKSAKPAALGTPSRRVVPERVTGVR